MSVRARDAVVNENELNAFGKSASGQSRIGTHVQLHRFVAALSRVRSSRRPSVTARSDPDDFPETTGIMTLIGKAAGNSNFRQRHFGFGKEFLCPAFEHIAVRGNSFRLLEGTDELGCCKLHGQLPGWLKLWLCL